MNNASNRHPVAAWTHTGSDQGETVRERQVTGAANYRTDEDPDTIWDAVSMAHMRMIHHAAQLGLAINHATIECRIIDCSSLFPGLADYQIQYSAWVGANA